MKPVSRTLAAVLALGLFATSCSFLRDKEPWDETVTYRYGDLGNNLVVEPLELRGDANYGVITVVNDTAEDRGFAIRELAVFEIVPKGLTITVDVDEAQDGETYEFTDHLNDGAFTGILVIEYVDEEFRDR